MADYFREGLEASLRRLSGRPVLNTAVEQLLSQVDQITAALGEIVLSQISAFTESRNPEVIPEIRAHAAAHTAELLRLLGGGKLASFEFVRAHARRRASQHFPLEAMLHAYRCGHKYYSKVLRSAVLGNISATQGDTQDLIAAIADFSIEYTDAISTVAATEYASHSRLMADIAVDLRTQLLNILLDGYDESDRRVAGILRSAGYLDQRQSFCVALAQATEPAEMAHAERARRMVASIDKTLEPSGLRRVIDLRDGKVTMIFSQIRRRSGWSAPEKSLALKVQAALTSVGISVRIGVSSDVPSTSFIPMAHAQAGMALEAASLIQPVLQFAQVRLRQLLLRQASDSLRHAVPRWTSDFLSADRRLRGALQISLNCYADSNMNLQKTAACLGVHANTLYARFQKIEDLTGLDPRNFHALNEMLLILDLSPVLGFSSAPA